MSTELPDPQLSQSDEHSYSPTSSLVALLPAFVTGGLTWFLTMVVSGAAMSRWGFPVAIAWATSIIFGLGATFGMWFIADRFLDARKSEPLPGVLWKGLTLFLKPLASLKLTVVLFLMSIFIVLIGTLAQVDSDIWEVINGYFRIQPNQVVMQDAPYVRLDELFVWVSPKLFYPPAFFPENPEFPKGLGWLKSVWPQGQPDFKDSVGIWFPRGWTIGMLMMLNLFAAHLVRFKVQAKGATLWCGLGVIALGILVTVAMIMGTSMNDGLQGNPLISSAALYRILQGTLFALAIPAVFGAVVADSDKWNLKVLLAGISLLMVGLGTGSFFLGSPENSQMWDAAMRVVYQQLQGLLAGMVLLVGCIMVFKKRAGVVLLHGGIGLMMLYEALVGTSHVESQMHINKGEESNYSMDIRKTEIAFVDRSQPDGVRQVVLDAASLLKTKSIDDPRLPFEVELVEWIPNAIFRMRKTVPDEMGNPVQEPLISTYGNDNERVLEPAEANVGTDSDQTDIPGAYVRLFRRADPEKNIPRKEIGVVLLSALTDLAPSLNFTETITVPADKLSTAQPATPEAANPKSGAEKETSWEVSLRFVRHYKPFTIQLLDVQKNDYVGTDSPKDYRSIISLTDQSGQVILPKHDIWMNNPMRFSGETYYQQSVMLQDGKAPGEKKIERTTLQVVKNEGWMAPYVACAIVGLGMIVQFMSTLMRFMQRSYRQGGSSNPLEYELYDDSEINRNVDGDGAKSNFFAWGIPLLCGILTLLTIASFARKREVYQLPETVAKAKMQEFKPVSTKSESTESTDTNEAKPATDVPELTIDDFRNFHLGEFARIPVFAGGRPAPLDTLATNQLMLISDRQTFKETIIDTEAKEQNSDSATNNTDDAKKEVAESSSKTEANKEATTEGTPKKESTTEEPKTKVVTRSATYWLLQMATNPDLADTYRIFRIENDEVTKSLKMEVSEDRMYAFADFEKSIPDLQKRLEGIMEKDKDERTVFDRKLLAFWSSVRKYEDCRQWFKDFRPDFKALVAQIQQQEGALAAMQVVAGSPERLAEIAKAAQKGSIPLIVPTHIGQPARIPGDVSPEQKALSTSVISGRDWETFAVATGYQFSDDIFQRTSPPALVLWQQMLAAWKDQNAIEFNARVQEYHSLLEQAEPSQLQKDKINMSLERTDFEDFFSRFAPFNALSWVYISVFLVTVVGWLLAGFGAESQSRIANRSGLVMAIVLMCVHTWAIGGRIYISGRPPVTNLYSSAVFIGWATVVAGIIFEFIYKLGIGNLLAAVSGFATLRIAHALSSDGDTFGVLQAVLDTQFWLATHVVCITLGYAATFVAGMMGVMYVIGRSRLGMIATCLLAILAGAGMSTMSDKTTARIGMTLLPFACIALMVPIRMFMTGQTALLSEESRKHLSRMIYGTLCAATALSFIGTVWGGLWADDSWGRFWGWDPKENGALIIVIWNALILHASWDKMVRDRGVAVLAIFGNVVTAWSWFGVNELGVGLHAYGFTEGRLFWLAAFCLSQCIIAFAGALPSIRFSSDKVTIDMPT